MRIHTKTFHIRFTEKEYERLCKYADKAGLPKTTYIRHMINGCRPKEDPGLDYFIFMNEFYRLGNKLNQITHLAHKFGSLHEAKSEQLYKQYLELVQFISQRMIEPDDLDVPATLERGRLLSEAGQNEEGQLKADVERMEADISKGEEVTADFQAFLANVRKYTDITELTPTVLNKFISRIEVHAPDKVDGKRVQQIDIFL